MSYSHPPSETDDRANPDITLSAVANERRRTVLRVLADADRENLPFETLVERLREDDGERPADDYRQRVRTELYHTHLPKLEACGMLVHNTERKQVRSVTGELGRELLLVTESYETHR